MKYIKLLLYKLRFKMNTIIIFNLFIDKHLQKNLKKKFLRKKKLYIIII